MESTEFDVRVKGWGLNKFWLILKFLVWVAGWERMVFSKMGTREETGWGCTWCVCVAFQLDVGRRHAGRSLSQHIRELLSCEWEWITREDIEGEITKEPWSLRGKERKVIFLWLFLLLHYRILNLSCSMWPGTLERRAWSHLWYIMHSYFHFYTFRTKLKKIIIEGNMKNDFQPDF